MTLAVAGKRHLYRSCEGLYSLVVPAANSGERRPRLAGERTFTATIWRAGVLPGNFEIPARRLKAGCSASELQERMENREPRAGIEPATIALQERRSTI